MTQQRDIEHLLDLWLADGASMAPDRVIDVVADRIERQPQRLARRVDWRHLSMNPLAKAGAALAAVTVIALVGYSLRPGSSGFIGVGLTPIPIGSAALTSDPSPTPTPTASPAGTVGASPTAMATPKPTRTVRSALLVPMSYTMSPGWTLYADTPTEVRIGFHRVPVSTQEESDANPDVSIGIPYGPCGLPNPDLHGCVSDSVASLLHFFRTVQYPDGGSPRDGCPMMATPERVTLAGLSGYEFNCYSESNGATPIYPRTRKGALEGIGSATPGSDDWFVVPKGGPFVDFLVVDVEGTPVIIAITGLGYGPAPHHAAQLAPETLASFASLGIDFTP